jgi:hypothetical protein
MAKRDLVQKATDYAYRRLAVPTAHEATREVGDVAKVVQGNPEAYARTIEAYLRWEFRFWWAVLVALGVIFVGGCGCFVFVAAFGNNDSVKFGGLASGVAAFLGLLFGHPAAKVAERRSALGDVIGYNIHFLSSVQECGSNLGCVLDRVKEYQNWIRTL